MWNSVSISTYLNNGVEKWTSIKLQQIAYLQKYNQNHYK